MGVEIHAEDISIKSSAGSLCEQCNLYLILIALILKDGCSVQYSFCSIQIIFFFPLISSTFIYLLITLIYSVRINDEQRDATCKNIACSAAVILERNAR